MKKQTEKVPRETTTEKKLSILIFQDGYVIVASNDKYSRKAMALGDRVKNAIKAAIKQGYTVELATISEPELPFTENNTTV